MYRKKEMQLTLRVQNMHCSACEQRIETELTLLEGVLKVTATIENKTLKVLYDSEKTTPQKIEQAIKNIHYSVTPLDAPLKADLYEEWVMPLSIATIFIMGYLMLMRAGWLNFFPSVERGTALPVLFIVGLLTSVHCIAMCGGINLSQSINRVCGKECSAVQKNRPAALYNAGRVASYTLIGGLAGWVGAVVTPSVFFKGILMMIASLFMLIMGANMLGFLASFKKIMPRMPRALTERLSRKRAGKGPFIVGMLNGLMPCGPLQAMQLYALSTGNAFVGALSMFLFSLGTVPLMLALGVLSSLLSARFTSGMMKVGALLVIFLGAVMFRNGLSLSGWF